jgi:hypothetical protein
MKLPIILAVSLLSSAASAAVEQPEQKPCREPCVIYDDSTPEPRIKELLNQFEIRYRDLNKFMFGAPWPPDPGVCPVNPVSPETIMCDEHGCREITTIPQKPL